jgi:hypothetical protein
MTPSELVTFCRQKYNAVGDDFWSADEMLDLVYQAEMELALEALVIENSYTATTVDGQQAYPYPTQAIQLKRITWDGTKLAQITMREDDLLTNLNSATVDTGQPDSFFVWEDTVNLRPIPGSAKTLKIWSIDRPQELTGASTTLDVPVHFHMDLTYYVLREMALKDGNIPLSIAYGEMWEKRKAQAKKFQHKKNRGGAPAHINDINFIPQSDIGSL